MKAQQPVDSLEMWNQLIGNGGASDWMLLPISQDVFKALIFVMIPTLIWDDPVAIIFEVY
jgi:hypothetical protein